MKRKKSRFLTMEDYIPEQLSEISLDVSHRDRVPRGIEVEENRIYFYAPITEIEVLELNRLLRRLDVEMKYLSDRLECDPVPIHLHLHSPGGSVFAGLSVVDTINGCSTKIHTHIDGSAASAATLIAASGTEGKRTIGKNGFMLIHQPYLVWDGKLDDFMDEVKNQEEIYSRVKKIYSNRTKLNGKKLENLLQKELWLPAEKCLKFGLVDEIK